MSLMFLNDKVLKHHFFLTLNFFFFFFVSLSLIHIRGNRDTNLEGHFEFNLIGSYYLFIEYYQK